MEAEQRLERTLKCSKAQRLGFELDTLSFLKLATRRQEIQGEPKKELHVTG